MKDLYLSTFKKYTQFSGRAGKKEFWTFTLVNVAISLLLSMILGMLKLAAFSSIFSLVILLPSLAVGVRRMHDIGKEWWYILIPLYNIILALQSGDEGANQYGEEPTV